MAWFPADDDGANAETCAANMVVMTRLRIFIIASKTNK